MLLLSALLSVATAQEEACLEIYTADQFELAIRDATSLLERGEIPRAIDVLGGTRDKVRCMGELVQPEALVSFARVSALAAFYNQEAEVATRWGQLVELLAPEAPWPDLDDTHPLRSLLEDATPPTLTTLDQGFALERNGSVFLDSRFLPSPQAHTGVPHLVQVFNGKGHLLDGYWQDGAAFRDSLLGDQAGPIKPPRYFDPQTRTITPKGPPPDPYAEFKRRDVPVTTWIGGGLVVASAALYAVAGTRHARFTCDPTQRDNCPSSPSELTQLRNQTNALTAAAGLTFVGGLGVGVTGLLVDGGPGIRVGGRL